uniref:Uncharacterized protein n=1 Tax=Arundo donax TaxID=35708 RepID=A0A0A9H0Y4_ARUDO
MPVTIDLLSGGSSCLHVIQVFIDTQAELRECHR